MTCAITASPLLLAAVLELVPGGNGHELDERSLALRVCVSEITGVLDPGHVEQSFLHPVVEPRTTEDELAQPVDERFPVDERESLPVTNDVQAESAPRLVDATVRNELDQVVHLVHFEVVRADEPDAHGGCRDPLLEVLGVELETVTQELDHEVVPGAVVRCEHRFQAI